MNIIKHKNRNLSLFIASLITKRNPNVFQKELIDATVSIENNVVSFDSDKLKDIRHKWTISFSNKTFSCPIKNRFFLDYKEKINKSFYNNTLSKNEFEKICFNF